MRIFFTQLKIYIQDGIWVTLFYAAMENDKTITDYQRTLITEVTATSKKTDDVIAEFYNHYREGRPILKQSP